LLLAIKKTVDEDHRPGRFLLTGSANVLTLPRVADSLAGRKETLQMLPLSRAEITGRLHRSPSSEDPASGLHRPPG
jgi:predicted AAA+ superfamily ATPase